MTTPSKDKQPEQNSQGPTVGIVKPTETVESPPPTTPKNNRSRSLWIFSILIVVVGVIWLFYYLLYLQFHQYTDDAYANGNMVNINSAIPGSVISFFADDTDLVIEGQLLVKLDPTDYQARYDKELATLAETVLQVRKLYDTVLVNISNVESQRTSYERYKYDFDNRAKLIDALAVSNEDYTHAKDAYLIAELSLQMAEHQLQVSKDDAGNTPIEQHPLIEQQKAAVIEAYYNLKHCEIYAPTTGYVAQRNVQVGEWVSPSINLMAVIPTDYVWVDANFKETQLKYMRIGQPATVWLDLYSGVEIKGKVLGIASGSGSVFSLIPPQNATGNWIKIVQRLAVRIGLDKEMIKKYPIRLGISAEVNVDITDQNLPYLATEPILQPVATTKVFDINIKEAERIIDEIISLNLKQK